MKDLLVHIGYHKTGTTWLQHYLFKEDSNIFFTLSTTSAGGTTLAEPFFWDNDHKSVSSFDDNREEVMENLGRILKSKGEPGGIPVISHERLSGNPHSGGYDSPIIARRIKSAFPEARILIIVREQINFIRSCYFQYLAIGGTDSIRNYINRDFDGKRPGFSLNYPDYLPLVKEYMRLFGHDRVLVLPYELFRHQPHEFIGQIGSFLGTNIDPDGLDFGKTKNRRSNSFVRYYFRYLNIFRKSSSVNAYSIFHNFIFQGISEFIFFLFGLLTPPVLDRITEKKILKRIRLEAGHRYDASNRDLQTLIGQPLDKLWKEDGQEKKNL